jgi:hypothetical protein
VQSRALPSRQGVEPTDCFTIQLPCNKAPDKKQLVGRHNIGHWPQSTSLVDSAAASGGKQVHERTFEKVLLQRNPISGPGSIRATSMGIQPLIIPRGAYAEKSSRRTEVEMAEVSLSRPFVKLPLKRTKRTSSDQEAIRSAFGRPPLVLLNTPDPSLCAYSSFYNLNTCFDLCNLQTYSEDPPLGWRG